MEFMQKPEPHTIDENLHLKNPDVISRNRSRNAVTKNLYCLEVPTVENFLNSNSVDDRDVRRPAGC